MREERDLDQAAQLALPGDGGVTGQALSLRLAPGSKFQMKNVQRKSQALKNKNKITWAQACKLDESVLAESFIGFIFFRFLYLSSPMLN